MNAEIISVGTELLLGDVINKDAAIVAKKLSEIGIGVRYTAVVGDNSERLAAVLKDALSRADLVITTGGLGPTDDDLTKETIASVAGKTLVLHEGSLQKINDYFEGRPCSSNQKKQAMLPEGCYVLKNDHGTAPGCVITLDNGKMIAMLPGPPRELTPMLNNYLIPYIKESNDVIVSQNVRVFGMGEGTVADKIKHLMEQRNPTVAPYAGDGEMYVRVTAKAQSREEAESLIAPVVSEICEIVGEYVYTTEYSSLEETVLHLLLDQKKTVATAESCTGGLVAKRITDLPSSSEVFEMGAVTYSNRIKTLLINVPEEMLIAHGAVSPQVAQAMAEGVRNVSGADIGVGITGVAGPGGGTKEKPVGLVYVAVADKNKTYVNRLIPYGATRSRDFYRVRAASTALDMVRRLLTNKDVIA